MSVVFGSVCPRKTLIPIYSSLRYDASSYDSLLSPPYLLALLLGATLALTCWELASKIFDRDFSVAISASSLHNVATLLTGLSKDNSSFIRYLAFLELQRTVRYSPDARGDVFGDLDPAGGKWGRIRSECLGVIEEAAVAAEGVLETCESLWCLRFVVQG